MCALYWKASTLVCFSWKAALILKCSLILKCKAMLVQFAGQVIVYVLLHFFIWLLEKNAFAIKWNLKAITIDHTTRWSFFSAFPAEGAETVGLNSLGLWDFTVFTVNEIENSLFFFFLLPVMQDWACLHSYMAVSVIFYLYTVNDSCCASPLLLQG